MTIKHISLVFPYLPKYDIDFLQTLKREVQDLSINVYVDMSSNDLYRDSNQSLNFNIIHTKIYKFGPFWLMPNLYKLLKNNNPNRTVIFNANPRDLTQVLLMLIFKLRGRKFISWGMFHRIGGPKWYSSLYFKFVAMISSRVFVYGQMGKSNLINLGLDCNKIDKIGNAIKFPSKTIDKSKLNLRRLDILRNYPYIKDKFLLLQVVRLTEIKKPFLFLDLIKELKSICNDFHIILIGGGLLEAALKSSIKKNFLNEYITFVGPVYDEDDLASWYSISNVFVMPTCIGLSAHQSMFYGLPVITDNSMTNQASESEILIDGFNCLRYQEGNIKDFAEKINLLKNNRDMLSELSANSSSNVHLFSIEKKAHNFLQGLSNLEQS